VTDPADEPTPDPAPVPAAEPAARRAVDPVRQRRARVAQLVSTGQRIGYGLFAVAVVAFFVGFVVGFDEAVVDLIVGCIIVGSLVLAPSIVFSYAVKAAERDDLEHGR
jgi:hypothetical protein